MGFYTLFSLGLFVLLITFVIGAVAGFKLCLKSFDRAMEKLKDELIENVKKGKM